MISKSRIVLLLCLMISVGSVLQGCRKTESPLREDDILLIMGDSMLTMHDVIERIPVGLSASDSVELFDRLVKGWIENMVLLDLAREKLPDLDEIEQKVSAYRNRLIVMSYLAKVRSNSKHKVSEDSIRKFYARYHKEMLAERPLVKGLLLKFPESVAGLNEIKRCVFTADDKSLDELERKWAADALQYEYFENTWVDWQNIAEQIPYRFFDPDAFVSSTKNFETSSGGSVYLLHISEYLPSGSELPYEFSAPRIRAILEQAKVSNYEEALVESLTRKAIAEDKLVVVGYDPVSRRLIKDDEEKEKRNRDEK